MSRPLTASLAGVAVFGLASAAPVPKDGEPPLYFPTEVGTKWVMRFHYSAKVHDDHTYTAAVEEKDGAKLVTVSVAYTGREAVVRPGREEESEAKAVERPDGRYRVSAGGVFRVADYDFEKKELVDLKEPKCVLRLPAKPGDSEKGKDGLYKWTSTVGKPERIKVPAGTFDAVRIDLESTQNEGPLPHRTGWYAPGIGLVKSMVGKEVGVELISFTPAKK